MSRAGRTVPNSPSVRPIPPLAECGKRSTPVCNRNSTIPQLTLRRYVTCNPSRWRNFFHDERRNFTSEIDCVSEAALGFEVTNREKEGRYTLHKTILGDPYQNWLLVHVRVDAPLPTARSSI